MLGSLTQAIPCSSARRKLTRRAISSIELLVVFSIVLFVLALLFPGVSSVRERMRRVQCQNNLHHWGIALQMYSDDYDGYIPMEGTNASGIYKDGQWYNELPQYLDLPRYREFEGANKAIRDLPNIHLWICPAKNRSASYKSGTGMNQFHYGMNQVLDGMGKPPDGSKDTPGFPNPEDAKPLSARMFQKKPKTVFMFDIRPNSPRGSPRDVGTEFHGDYANVLYMGGDVGHCQTDDLVENGDLRRGPIRWNHPNLYWGYPPPHWPTSHTESLSPD